MGKPSWQPSKDMQNLEGKVAVVTGANAGIGLKTTKHLALHGAKVYFTARSEAKAQHVRSTVLSEAPQVLPDHLVWLKMDLLDTQSILEAAAEVGAKEDKIDILINNAALIPETLGRNEQGWEYGISVNHFGPYIFTMALMPLLKAAALAPDSDVRIVNTGTNAHRLFISDNYPLDFSSPALWSAELPYMPWVWNYFGRFCFKNDMVRYGLSKLTLAMLTRDLQRRLDAANIPIICTSPHPGAVATPGLHELVTPMFLVIVRLVFLSEDQGSWHQLFMATDKAVRQDPERYKGVYFEQFGTPHPGHASLRNEEACRQVWENTAKEVDSYLSKAGLEALPKW